MSEQPRPPRDRYDTSGNIEAEYVDAEQTVLVNKRGLSKLEELQLAEEEVLAKAYETLLAEIRINTPMTCDLVRYIHARIFGDLFEWAGRWRTVTISKPGITWPPPMFVPKSMEEFEHNVLRNIGRTNLQMTSDSVLPSRRSKPSFSPFIHSEKEMPGRSNS